ncbi:hypothetical protein NP493_2108g00004 [Ridgeia piscesae]|uniref:Tubulin--tyrosine ligase-like protein 12 SET-like domain-containing protein n=1 Tax=Ridgeia piscesae TaxID=27915 RepID=A0AAD9JMC0_RIDPI|nr:hypothetical protein NP493_2108g00004 [Ridgeia piscesae]
MHGHWTYRVDEARRQLDGLLSRMVSIMDIDSGSKLESPRAYQDSNGGDVEGTDAAVSIWYFMDEFGSRIQHSDTPSFRLVPFYFVPKQTSFTTMWPVTAMEDGDEVTRDYIEGVPQLREIRLTPWQPRLWTHLSMSSVKSTNNSYRGNTVLFQKHKVHKSIPNLDVEFPALPQEGHINVYADNDQISQYLTDKCFHFVEDTESTDMLWTREYLKDFKYPDMMAMVARRAPSCQLPCENSLTKHPKWLAATYNLQTELPQFVSFQHRQARYAHDLGMSMMEKWYYTNGFFWRIVYLNCHF